MAAVSLNLAIFNLLPMPILDGGVMLMLLVEMLMRRDLDLRVKEAVVKGGLRVSDGGGGFRNLQRHFQDSAAGLSSSVGFEPFALELAAGRYRPCQQAFRFSRNALIPSCASAASAFIDITSLA